MTNNVPTAKLCVITSTREHLCKEFFIDENRQIDKKSHGVMSEGSIESFDLNLTELKRAIKSLNNEEALCIGSRKPEFEAISSLTTSSKVVDGETIARSKNYFEFNDAPAFMVLDYDEKDLTPSELHRKLLELVPEFEGVGMLIVPSSSAGVYFSRDTQPTEIKSSCHIYMIAEKGSCIPEIGEFIKYRAWEAGLGFIKISKAGSVLERHIFDDAVYSPERLVFDAPPLLGKGLSQVPRQIIQIEGGMADSSVLKITDAERIELESLINDAKLKAKPECDEIKSKIKKNEVEKLTTAGKTVAEAEKIIEQRFEGVLTDSNKLRSRKHGVVTVGEILANPDKFKIDGFIDPEETDTGTEYRAKVYFNDNGSVRLHSLRHGGRNYVLEKLESKSKTQITSNEFTDWMEDLTLSKEEANAISNPEWIIEDIVIRGHLIAIPAKPNGGKTTIFFHLAGEMVKKGCKVFYVNADIAGGDAKTMCQEARDLGVSLVLPDFKGSSMSKIVEKLEKLNDGTDNLEKMVFIFDTLKKMTEVIEKSKSKKLYATLRGLTAKGATVILLAHTNKYNDSDGMPVYEGTGDLRADVDELIYLIPVKKPDGSMTVSTKLDKVRGAFKPVTFEISADRKVKRVDAYVDTTQQLINADVLKEESKTIEVIRNAINSGENMRQLIIPFCKENGGISRRTVDSTLEQNVGTYWKLNKGEKNAQIYSLI